MQEPWLGVKAFKFVAYAMRHNSSYTYTMCDTMCGRLKNCKDVQLGYYYRTALESMLPR